MDSTQRPLRILNILTMLEIGGAQWIAVLSTEDALRRGHQAWLAAAPGPFSEEARRRIGDALIEVPALAREINPVRDARAFSSLVRLIKRLRPDVIHTHSSKAGILGRWAAWAAGWKVSSWIGSSGGRSGSSSIVHTAHGWGFHDRQSKSARFLYETAERLTAMITDKIIVVAESNRIKALKLGIGRADQFVTIRAGIEIDSKELLRQRRHVRAELGIRAHDIMVISVGNYKPQKAPLAMAAVVERILALRPDLHFISIGDGPLKADVESVLGRHPQLSSRIKLLGWREDAVRILAACDVLLHTAIFEGLPRVVLEAVALGIPVVSTNVDGIPEVIADHVNGFLFQPGDIAGMTRAILLLSDDAQLRSRMSEKARESFRAEFTLQEMFNRLEATYQGLV